MRSTEYNRHHIIHDRAVHSANMHTRWFRNAMGLIVPMDIEVHKELHQACPSVPPVDPHTAERAKSLYRPTPDPLKAIDNYSFAIQEAIQHPRTHRIEKGMALLSIEAVQAQKRFIREGAIRHELVA